MNNKLFKNYKGVFENSINNLMKEMENNNSNSIKKILEIMYLIMYRERINEDTINMFKLLGIENFVKIISLLGGKTIKFESKDKIQDYLILSIIYYYKEIKGMGLKEIQNILPFDLNKENYISYGIRIKNFNSELKKNIQYILDKK